MNKTIRALVIVFVAAVLLFSAFGSGFAAGHFINLGSQPVLAAPNPTATVNSGQGGTPQDVQTLFTPFWQAWTLIHQEYVDQPVNDTTLMEGAINGMINALGDAHSSYLDPQALKDWNSQLSGQYAGIGAYVDTTGQLLTITAPMDGSPAQKAGLLPGDEIIAVDGQDMTGVNPETVRQKVLGAAGTTVVLTIQRSGLDKPFDVTITRANIVVPSVTSKMLPNNIAYIQITTFGENTAQDFHNQLAALMAKNPKGLILDLRNNGGGYLDTAIAVGSEFIDHGDIVTEQYGNGTKDAHPAVPGGLATKIPLVVLVNKGTASASEIVSGAIQDDQRGKLVGETTYGKGSVQNLTPLANNEGAARITIARWLTPAGRQIDKKGLTPDLVVTLTADDVKAGRDPQLDAAVKLLTTP